MPEQSISAQPATDSAQPATAQAIRITQPAADHVRSQLQRRGKGLGIRLGVRTSGCSGLAYLLEFVDEQGQDDLLIEQDGLQFFVDAESLEYLRGSQLDFVREGVNRGLRFVNPNVTAQCGCGESFTV